MNYGRATAEKAMRRANLKFLNVGSLVPRSFQKKGRGQDPQWYDRAFGRDYLLRYRHRSDKQAAAELPFLAVALALPKGALILDLCCGAGRYSRALQKAGYRLIAVDRSPALLHAACARRGGRGIRYLRADMRRLPLARASVDGAVNLFTSFGYFPSEAENLRVLREAVRVLKPGAPFVLDFLNAGVILKNLLPQSERRAGRLRLLESRYYQRFARRLVKLTLVAGGGSHELYEESVRAYTPSELGALFKRAGLKVVGRFGDLAGTPFRPQASLRCVLVGRVKKQTFKQ